MVNCLIRHINIAYIISAIINYNDEKYQVLIMFTSSRTILGYIINIYFVSVFAYHICKNPLIAKIVFNIGNNFVLELFLYLPYSSFLYLVSL